MDTSTEIVESLQSIHNTLWWISLWLFLTLFKDTAPKVKNVIGGQEKDVAQ